MYIVYIIIIRIIYTSFILILRFRKLFILFVIKFSRSRKTMVYAKFHIMRNDYKNLRKLILALLAFIGFSGFKIDFLL